MTLAVGKSNGRKSCNHSVLSEALTSVATTFDAAFDSECALLAFGVHDQVNSGCPPRPWTATMLQVHFRISTLVARPELETEAYPPHLGNDLEDTRL